MGLNKSAGMLLYQNKEWLIHKYIGEKINMVKLAKLSGCSYVTLWKWMNHLNIKRRKSGQNPDRKYNHIKLNNNHLNFIAGLLLGDGSLDASKKSNIALYTHGDKHLNYIVWLMVKLKSMGFKCGNINPIGSRAFKFKTLSYVELFDSYKRFYPNGAKILPSDLKMTPCMLKNWYIGDGNNSVTPLIDSVIFPITDIKKFISPLSQHEINFSLRSFKSRTRLRISSKSKNNFFNYILSKDPEIPPGYKYKFSGECDATK